MCVCDCHLSHVCVHVCVFVWLFWPVISHTHTHWHMHTVSVDHDAQPDVPRYRGSLNEDSASANWSSPYAERNVSHSVAYTSTGKGRTKWLMLQILTTVDLSLSLLLLPVCPSFKMASLTRLLSPLSLYLKSLVVLLIFCSLNLLFLISASLAMIAAYYVTPKLYF